MPVLTKALLLRSGKEAMIFIVLPMVQLSLSQVLLPYLLQQVDCLQELLKSVVLRLL